MYWFSETLKGTAADWRPEVHDSDGLALWTGGGERIWRPLNNPPRTMTSAFADDNPKGFGLMQRDRVFDHYQDGVAYERRPSLWVEPVGGWGRGAVQLIEIPTDDEIHDNIVAAWVPAEPVKAGAALDLAYKLHWQGGEPPHVAQQMTLARTVASRIGNGGEPGQPRPQGVKKFVVEFFGPFARDAAVGRQAGGGRHRLARRDRQPVHRGADQRRRRPLARGVRPQGGARRSGRIAVVPAPARPGPDRDLGLPVACGIGKSHRFPHRPRTDRNGDPEMAN